MTANGSPIKAERLDANETTPLIAASAAGPTAQANEEPILEPTKLDVDDNTPLPKWQIVLLCYARMVEPIAFFSIVPYINQMIHETSNVSEEDVGFYSGLIESLFSLVQMMTMIAWGRAADRFGRKPILVVSLVGISVGTALFGFSKSIWQMAMCRCFAGVFAGTLVTIRAMFSENSTPKTQARAFSFFAFAGNIGILIGPFIGGGLSNPVTQYPRVFGHSSFFAEYPYALASIVSGAFAFSAAILSALFVKETLDVKDHDPSAPPPMSTWELAKSPGVGIVLFLYCHTIFIALAFTAVVPVFWFVHPSLGGWGFSPFMISVFLGIAGISQALWTLLLFPPLQRRFGTGGVLRGCYYLWPIQFIILPLCNVFLRQGWISSFWTVSVITNVLSSGVAMAFTGTQLALNDIAPSHQTLGTLNALALTLISAIRAFTPALFTSIFAFGIKIRWLGGHLVWVVLFAMTLVLVVAVRWLPQKAEGRLKRAVDEEED